jgi:hypothetical protein
MILIIQHTGNWEYLKLNKTTSHQSQEQNSIGKGSVNKVEEKVLLSRGTENK